jgi:hypothetical protein
MSAYDPKHHEWLSIIPFQEQTIIVAEPGLECVVKPLHRNDAICAAFHTKVYVSDTFLISNRNLGTMEATTHYRSTLGYRLGTKSNREEEKKMNKQMTRAEIELVLQGFARLAPISDKARPIDDTANLYGYFIVTDSDGNVRKRWL